MFPQIQMKDVYAFCSSIVGYIVAAKTIFYATVPFLVQNFVTDHLRSLFERTTGSSSTTLTLIIEDRNLSANRNSFYNDVQDYIGSTRVNHVGKKMKVTMESSETKLRLSLAENEVVHDIFHGIKLEFKHNKVENADPNKTLGHEFIEIKCDEKHRDVVLNRYLPHVASKAAELRIKNKSSILLYTHPHRV